MDEVYTCVYGSSKGHFVAQPTVAIDESFDGPYSAVCIIEVLLLIEVTNHLADIIGSVTKLSQLPVNEDELVSFSTLLQL
jgi:hypothetical protein